MEATMVGINPFTIDPDWSIITLLAFGGSIVAILWLVKRKRISLAWLVLLFCGAMFVWGLSSRVVLYAPDVKWAYAPRPPEPIQPRTSIESAQSPRLTDHGSSLDALWERLNESRIDLTENSTEEAEPTLDASDEEATEAVAETFGLSAEGQLPPYWVVTPPKAIGNVFRVSVASDPFVTVDECRKQLEAEFLPRVVSRRIEQLVAGDVGHPVKVDSPLPLGIGLDYIFREICVDEFTGTVDSSVGEMKKVHVLMEFNDSVDRELRNAWLQHERNSRLQAFGTYALLAIAGLAAVYGLLRIDTLTRGYYSQQLLWGSAVAIIALVFLLVK